MNHENSVKEITTTKFTVTVKEGNSKTTHEVSVTDSDVTRYAPGTPPQVLLQASFKFLLQREPKESILRQFTLSDIEHYFPDFPTKITELISE